MKDNNGNNRRRQEKFKNNTRYYKYETITKKQSHDKIKRILKFKR